ncbi:hypothetical protein ANANG_G00074340, partial [Anguilla anguilla]
MSQDNVSDKVRNLQRQIAQSIKFGPKPHSSRESEGSSDEEDTPTSPLQVQAQVEVEAEAEPGLSQGGIQMAAAVVVKSPRSKRAPPAAGTIESINLDAVPQSCPRLDSTAARHKLSVKPKNQRVSRKHRRTTQDLQDVSHPGVLQEEPEPQARAPSMPWGHKDQSEYKLPQESKKQKLHEEEEQTLQELEQREERQKEEEQKSEEDRPRVEMQMREEEVQKREEERQREEQQRQRDELRKKTEEEERQREEEQWREEERQREEVRKREEQWREEEQKREEERQREEARKREEIQREEERQREEVRKREEERQREEVRKREEEEQREEERQREEVQKIEEERQREEVRKREEERQREEVQKREEHLRLVEETQKRVQQEERERQDAEKQRIQDMEEKRRGEEHRVREAEVQKEEKQQEEEEKEEDLGSRQQQAEELRWREMEDRQRPFTFKVSSGEKQILFQKVNLTPVTPCNQQGGASDSKEVRTAPTGSADSPLLPGSLYVPHTAILVTGAQLCGAAVNLDQIRDPACKSLLGLAEDRRAAVVQPVRSAGKTKSLKDSSAEQASAAVLAEWASIRSRIFRGAEGGAEGG